jgi:hypothetical protein
MEFNETTQRYELTETEFQNLLDDQAKAQEYLTDLYSIRAIMMKILTVFKITDATGNNVRQSIIDKQEKPLKSFIKGGMGTFKLMMAAQISADAEKELNDQWDFLDTLTPYLTKYGVEKQKELSEGSKAGGNNA